MSDIEFSVGLDISPAEQKINQLQENFSMADAVFERMQSNTYNNTSSASASQSPLNNSGSAQKIEKAATDHLKAAEKLSVAVEKLRLQTERAELKSEWKKARTRYRKAEEANDQDEMASASEAMTTAEGKFAAVDSRLKDVYEQERNDKRLKKENTTQREITDEVKAQGREYNDHYIKLSKFHKLLLSILGIWQAIKKAVGFNFDVAGRLNQEKGFFSVDRETAYEANRDKEYAMLQRGLENMGKAAPYSSEDVAEMAKTIQEMRLKAMSGQGVENEPYVIAMQRAFDNFGIGVNAAQLLSDGSVKTLDIVFDMIRALENKVLPGIQKMSGVDKELATSDVMLLFGSKIVDGVMAHLNKNAITGGTETSIDQAIRLGGNAVSFNDITTASSEVVDAFAETKKTFDQVKQVLLVEFAPALTFLSGKLNDFGNWLADTFHFIMPSNHFSPDRKGLVNMGSFEQNLNSVRALKRTEMEKGTLFGQDRYTIRQGTTANEELDWATTRKGLDAIKNQWGSVENYAAYAHKKGTSEERFNALFYNSPVARTKEFGSSLEDLKGAYILERLSNWFLAGALPDNKYDLKYEELGGLDVGKFGAALAQRKVPSNVKSYEDFINFIMKDSELAYLYQQIFGEGGSLNIGSEGVANPWMYLQKGFSGGNWLDFLSRFSQNAGKEELGDMIKAIVPKWYDDNHNGVIDLGEVRLVIDYNLPDNSHNRLELKQDARGN